MPTGRWKEDGITMQLDLLHKVTDTLWSNFTENLGRLPTDDISPFYIVASPPENREEPLLSFWPIAAFFDGDLKTGTPSFQTGVQVGNRGVTISAFFLFALNSDDSPMRANGEIVKGEFLNLVGTDLDKNAVHILAQVIRDEDTNSINLGEVIKIMPTPDTTDEHVDSKALDSFLKGYVSGLHIFKYGVELDPANPYKLIKN